jgi:hypothetical protein
MSNKSAELIREKLNEVNKIGEIVGNIQLTPKKVHKPPTSPVAGSCNQHLIEPTKLQIRKINFNEYKKYFEDTSFM